MLGALIDHIVAGKAGGTIVLRADIPQIADRLFHGTVGSKEFVPAKSAPNGPRTSRSGVRITPGARFAPISTIWYAIRSGFGARRVVLVVVLVGGASRRRIVFSSTPAGACDRAIQRWESSPRSRHPPPAMCGAAAVGAATSRGAGLTRRPY